MNSPDQNVKAAPYRPRRAALNWVDYLVIAATALTFGAVVVANNPHAARAQTRATIIPAAELPTLALLHDAVIEIAGPSGERTQRHPAARGAGRPRCVRGGRRGRALAFGR